MLGSRLEPGDEPQNEAVAVGYAPPSPRRRCANAERQGVAGGSSA